MSNYLSPPSTIPPGSTVDAYLRDSGGPRQDASTDQQLAEIEAYCAQYGLILRNKYIDVAKSGGSTVARDNFNALIDSTRQPETRPQALLLWNYARFARDLDDAIYYKALLRNRNILVHSLTDPIPEGQYGRIVEFFIDISNEEKRRQTSTDAKRGLRDLVLKHGCVPGTPPRGFMRQPVSLGNRRDNTPRTANRWVPDPEFIPRIQRAFAMRAYGSTLAEIHAELHLFSGISSYKALFTNRLYIGILEFGDLAIENYCEPLVDMPTWNIVQNRIQTHSQAKYDRLHPRRTHSPYILSGLVYCGSCGAPMSANTVTGGQRGRNEAYRCSRAKRRAGCTAGRIGRRTLEQAVINTFKDFILLPDSLAAMYEIEQRATDHRQTRRTERIAILTAEKKKLSSQIANLTRAIAERGHTQTLLEKLNELESQRAQANIEITTLTNQVYAPTQMMTWNEILKLSSTLNKSLTENPPEKVRKLIQTFTHKIVVSKNENGQITGSITYFTPLITESPPFSDPLSAESEAGYNLPISPAPLGAQKNPPSLADF
jgi:DNA invertase Pin-like site-specific DNA recombinase